MARMPPGGEYGGGYLKVQRHLRTAVISMGFALVTTTPFTADLTVPSITQAQLTGYKYPARTVRQTEFQNGWLETAANPPFDATVTVAPIGQSRLDGYRYPAHTVRQTEFQDGWVETGTHDWAVERTPYSLDERMVGREALTYRYDGYGETPWIFGTLPDVWDASKFQNNSGDRTPAQPALRYRYDGYSATDWVYENLPIAEVWDESKFQNNSGELTPTRAALKFRYPLASTGFSTDGSSPDVWDESKFQNNSGDRTPIRKALLYRYEGYPTTDWLYENLPVVEVWDESKFQPAQADRMPDRRQYDPRYEHHKFSFGLLDARVVMPAIDQLATSERAVPRRGVPIVTPDSLGWLYENLPVVEVWDESKFQNGSGDRTPTRKALLYRYDGYPATDWLYENLPVAFDPQYLIHSDDSRMRERYKKVPQLDQPAQDWIFTAGPPFDARLLIQVSAPHRMAERAKLDLQAGQFYNDLAWARDVLNLPDPTEEVGPIIILGGGDDAPAKRKRQKTFQDLYQEIERTLHALVHQKPAVGVPLVPAGRLDQALAELSQLAQGQRVLVQQVVGLREEIARLEQARHQAILDDDADWEWFA